MSKVLRQVQKVQEEFARVQEELSQDRVEATAGGGVVRVVADGHGRVLEVHIAAEAVDPADVQTLEDLVLAAVSQAQEQARLRAEERLRGVAGGFSLPGLLP
ncbi:MAG: YbaB/EbfC family nucleoid-associated protein [candidate division GAL15 bacterium]